MKRIIPILLTLMFLLTGCSKPVEEEPIVTYDEYYPNICAGITVGEEGYYSMFADVELHYYKGELADVELSNPVLLAFRHSEDWDGGYYVYSYEEIQAIIEVLKQYPELSDIVNELEQGLLMTEAST